MLLLYLRPTGQWFAWREGWTNVHILKMGSAFRGAYLLTRKVEFVLVAEELNLIYFQWFKGIYLPFAKSRLFCSRE